MFSKLRKEELMSQHLAAILLSQKGKIESQQSLGKYDVLKMTLNFSFIRGGHYYN